MPRLDPATNTLSVKVVYYGPGNSGKTTNLCWLHRASAPEDRTTLVGLDTTGDRTLFFEYFSTDLGRVANYQLKAEFYTVPGQDRYEETRRLVLTGADGVVLVADSDPSRLAANIKSLIDLRQALSTQGQVLNRFPLVLQWNKRDLPRTTSTQELSKRLNIFDAPEVEAIAKTGEGVQHTRDQILARVFTTLRQRLGRGQARA